MSQPIFLSDTQLAKLNQAHLKAVVAYQAVLLTEHALTDAQQKQVRANYERDAFVCEVGKEHGVQIVGWDEVTGQVNVADPPAE